MYIRRTLVAILLSALLTATASSQTKDSSKDKEPPKGPDKIEGKNLQEWLKIAETDKDSSLREQALQIIANFPSQEIRKDAAKLISRMESEPDTGVRLAVIDLVGSLGIEKAEDVKEAIRILASTAEKPGPLRLHAIQSLGKFGSKAHGRISTLISDVVTKDPSYEIRRTVSHTLGLIASSETEGPDMRVLRLLAGSGGGAISLGTVRDPSLPVRLQSLQSLFILGPPWDTTKPVVKNAPPPIDEKGAQEIIALLKSRITGTKTVPAAETNKQAELWCRLVIIKFGVLKDQLEQLDAIAAHLSDPESAVKVQALQTLSFLGEFAESKAKDVIKLLEGGGLAESASVLRTRQVVRAAALHTLGAMGVKAIDPILKTIENTKEYPEIRIAALDALAMLGEKAEPARELLKTIITDPANLKGDGVALLAHALTALGSMGDKARGAIPELTDLMARLDKTRDDRLKSPEHEKMLKSPEVQKLLDKMTEEEKKKLFENPEDQFKKLVEETIRFIKESTPGHPGGEQKKP